MASGPQKRVFFHVGAPKTGTTYLQQVLFQNREDLAAAGVLYPYADFGQSFRSMQDFRGAGWGSAGPSRFAGEWDTVAARARDWAGDTVIISNELLGGAAPRRVAAGVESVSSSTDGRPVAVHVIFTARDLARQLVSDWQEHVKHKHTVTLEKFVDDLVELGHDAPAPFGELFWGMHDPVHVLPRWADVVPRANVHLVTVPQPGAPRDTLWQRFCQVTGLDPGAYETDTKRSNASMGVAETELVRRINEQARDDIPDDQYDHLVRIVLAERILGGGTPKLTLPEHRMEWALERSRELVEGLRAAGYPVVGELEELMPVPEVHTPYVSPTQMDDTDIAPASMRAAVGLLKHTSVQRQRNQALKQELAEATAPPVRRTPRDRARNAYWRARGRAGDVARRLGVKR